MKYKMFAAAACCMLLMTGCSLLDEFQDLSESSVIEPEETAPVSPTEDEIREMLSERQEQSSTSDFELPEAETPEPFVYHDAEPDETEPEDVPPTEETAPADTGTSPVQTDSAQTAVNETVPAETLPAVSLDADTLICEQFSDHAALLDLAPEPSTGGAPLQVPERFHGKPLTAVSDYAFRDAAYANRLRLPETVTEIGSNAFSGSDLTDLQLLCSPVLHAGNFVFRECAKLETVYLHDMTADFGDGCFAESAAVSVRTENCSMRFGDRCFQEMPQLETVSFAGDTTFGDCCFRDCSALKSVAFSGGTIHTGIRFCDSASVHDVTVTDCSGTIGDLAFSGCESLRTLKIGAGITAFGYGVCRNCETLRNVYLPASLTSIGEDCFTGCTDLTIIAPEGSYALQFAKKNGFRTRIMPQE